MDVFTVVMDGAFSVAAPYCLTLLGDQGVLEHQMPDISITESDDNDSWNIVDIKKRPSSMKTQYSSSSSPKMPAKQVQFSPEVQVKFISSNNDQYDGCISKDTISVPHHWLKDPENRARRYLSSYSAARVSCFRQEKS